MIQESLVWEQPNNYFDHKNEKYPIRNVKEKHCTDLDSDELLNQKRTSWCLDNNSNYSSDDDDEQQLRQELIQRATTRLRRRLLEQGLQDVMSQVVGLQTQLETLRLDAATTIDTISDIFDYDGEKTFEGSLKMNRQMDVLERRLESHKSSLYQFVSLDQQQQQKEKEVVHHHHHAAENMIKTDSSSTSPLTALSMSRLSSLSLMSSIFGRSSTPSSSRATSISEQCSMKEQHYHEETISNLEDDDCISHIENIYGQQSEEEEEDHPFYDLAGKRSFRAGSFCGSVYHDNQQEQQLPPIALPAPGGNSAEIRWRRRQRRQRHQQHLEQQQQQYMSDNESLMSDDISSFSSISSLSNIVTSSRRFLNSNDFLHHPLSPITPPPNYHAGSFFEDQMQQQPRFYKDLTQSWLSNECYSQQQQWTDTIMQKTSIYPQRNVLDEAMSFLDGLSENGDDGGFGEDMYLLLRNPDLCCRPLSEIQSTMHELRQQQQQEEEGVGRNDSLKTMINLINPATWCQMGIKFSTDMIYKATCNSLQWCRFLSVLAAAVIISLLKGPEDIRRYSASF